MLYFLAETTQIEMQLILGRGHQKGTFPNMFKNQMDQQKSNGDQSKNKLSQVRRRNGRVDPL